MSWRPPDWREANAYPARASPYRWASEFLIRNRAFREAWERALRAGDRARSGPARARAREAALRVLREWGVDHPVPEAWRERGLPRGALDSPFVFLIPPYSVGTGQQIAKGAHHLVGFAFDVRMALEPQLARAKSALADYRSGYLASRGSAVLGAQRQRADYRALLRVLDARAAGASFPLIGATLFPGQRASAERARKLYARACALREHAYRDVALLGWSGAEAKRAP